MPYPNAYSIAQALAAVFKLLRKMLLQYRF